MFKRKYIDSRHLKKGSIFHWGEIIFQTTYFFGFPAVSFRECRMFEDCRCLKILNQSEEVLAISLSYSLTKRIIYNSGEAVKAYKAYKDRTGSVSSWIPNTHQSSIDSEGDLVAAWKRALQGSNPMITNRQSSIGEAKSIYMSDRTCNYIHTTTNSIKSDWISVIFFHDYFYIYPLPCTTHLPVSLHFVQKTSGPTRQSSKLTIDIPFSHTCKYIKQGPMEQWWTHLLVTFPYAAWGFVWDPYKRLIIIPYILYMHIYA